MEVGFEFERIFFVLVGGDDGCMSFVRRFCIVVVLFCIMCIILVKLEFCVGMFWYRLEL